MKKIAVRYAIIALIIAIFAGVAMVSQSNQADVVISPFSVEGS